MMRVQNSSSPTHSFAQLYILALVTIAVIAFLGQTLVQFSIQQQSSDANVINIAGRQRMLSQRISKASLVLFSPVMFTKQDRTLHLRELRTALALWQRSHIGLQHGDADFGLSGNPSEEVQALFRKIEPNFLSMLTATRQIVATFDQHPDAGGAAITPFMQTILLNEGVFLQGMNAIVSQYQVEAQDRVTRLRLIEGLLLLSTLGVLFSEGVFIFRPALKKLDAAIDDLIHAEVQIAYSERLARKNEELARKNAELDLAFTEALTLTKRRQPQARVVSYGHYQVQGVQGNYYDVHCVEQNSHEQLVCECAIYKRNNICSHSLAAAALHTALVPHHGTDTSIHRTPSTVKSRKEYKNAL